MNWLVTLCTSLQADEVEPFPCGKSISCSKRYGLPLLGLDCVYCRIAFTEIFPDMPMKSAKYERFADV
jgi:hypothetical protein